MSYRNKRNRKYNKNLFNKLFSITSITLLISLITVFFGQGIIPKIYNKDVHITGVSIRNWEEYNKDLDLKEFIKNKDIYEQCAEACINRVFFKNNTGKNVILTKGSMIIKNIEFLNEPALGAQGYIDEEKHEAKICLTNWGWGKAENVEVSIKAYIEGEMDAIEFDFLEEKNNLKKKIDIEKGTIKIIDGYKFRDEEVCKVLKKYRRTDDDAVKITFFSCYKYKNEKIEYPMGFVQLYDDALIYNNYCIGGGLECISPQDYVFIDYKNPKKEYSLFSRTKNPVLNEADQFDILIIPNKSCKIDYILRFTTDGKTIIDSPLLSINIPVPSIDVEIFSSDFLQQVQEGRKNDYIHDFNSDKKQEGTYDPLWIIDHISY